MTTKTEVDIAPMMAVFKIGYVDYVLPADKAMLLVQLLSTAEVYKTESGRDTDGNYRTHCCIVPVESCNDVSDMSLRMLPMPRYKMLKMAGEGSALNGD